MERVLPERRSQTLRLGVGASICIFLVLLANAQIAQQSDPDSGPTPYPTFRGTKIFGDRHIAFVSPILSHSALRVPSDGTGISMCWIMPIAASKRRQQLNGVNNLDGPSQCRLPLGRQLCGPDRFQNSSCEFHVSETNHANYKMDSSLARMAGTGSAVLFFGPTPPPDYDSPSGIGLLTRELNSIKPNLDVNLLRPDHPPFDTETFHWKRAFTQSFKFLLEEHSFRMASDPLARHLVWHKRFWDDYLQSANHFVMSRWGDGDDFLINYIGHPMEGAVSGLIEIQNDPHGRSAKFGESSLYWQSRLKAMLWAGAYSAYFEIGPIFSEAALGNEGGYTYVPRCGLGYCSKRGRTFKPATNNTGWVDFTVTPIIGTGWIILEDSIEREIVDRIAKDDPRFRYKLLRAGLGPSHAMANMLAGKYPWYRLTVADETALNSSKAYSRNSSPYDQNTHEGSEDVRNEWGLGIGYTNVNLPRDWEGCSACRVNNSGLALDLDRRLSRWFAFDAEADLLPSGNGPGEKGGADEGLFGVKIGHPNRAWGVFTTVRIGFIYYDKALATNSSNRYVNMTRFASDVGEFFEYYPSPHSTVRFGVGDTVVRYLTGRVDPDQPPVSVLSTDLVMTHSNLQIRSEYVYRF
jgi:hypothetical protein